MNVTFERCKQTNSVTVIKMYIKDLSINFHIRARPFCQQVCVKISDRQNAANV